VLAERRVRGVGRIGGLRSGVQKGAATEAALSGLFCQQVECSQNTGDRVLSRARHAR
jgi:hypothetical protein